MQNAKATENQIRHLLSLYQSYANKDAAVGGSQTLVVKHPLTSFCSQLILPGDQESPKHTAHTTIDDLPDDILFFILCRLPPVQLYRISRVSVHWYQLSSSEILWKPLLEDASHQWESIYYHKNPDLIRGAFPSISSRKLFAICHPSVAPIESAAPCFAFRLPSTPFNRPPPPRLVIFGPGIEGRSSSGLIRRIITDEHFSPPSECFRVLGMVPGGPQGIGSGLKLQAGGISFDLITLYSEAKKQRDQWVNPADRRLQSNRLFRRHPAGAGGFTLFAPVMELCRTASAFIFVVEVNDDTNNTENEVATILSVWREELFAIVGSSSMGESGETAQPPLLVLVHGADARKHNPAVPAETRRNLSCLDVARVLKLGRLATGKWLLQAYDFDSLRQVFQGISWLLKNV